MSEKWSEMDAFLAAELVPYDPVLEGALEANKAAGLPAYDVTPHQGKLLHIYARMVKAERILEIGTLGGYSTIWLARALGEGGRLITLEANPANAEVALENISVAGLSDKVELKLGMAHETLPELVRSEEPFDLIFIDADKKSMPQYMDWALQLSKSGTVIISDNVVRNGDIIEEGNTDKQVLGIRQFFKDIAANPKLTATAIQTVGCKGWDGFAITIVD